MKHINVALFVVHKGCPHTCSFCNQRSISGSTVEITAAQVHESAATAIKSLSESEAAGGVIIQRFGDLIRGQRSTPKRIEESFIATAKVNLDIHPLFFRPTF